MTQLPLRYLHRLVVMIVLEMVPKKARSLQNVEHVTALVKLECSKASFLSSNHVQNAKEMEQSSLIHVQDVMEEGVMLKQKLYL